MNGGRPVETRWHALDLNEVGVLLRADPTHGLSAQEAAQRLREFGPNRLTPKKRITAFRRFLREFHDPLVYILLIASLITLALGETVDAAVIFGVVLINAIVGFIQETRSESAIEALERLIVTTATVVRDGQSMQIKSEELVPGDVVSLQTGDRVPADIRMLSVRSLHIDESALTGESLPVEKHAGHVASDAVLAERKNLVFAGTNVTGGHGRGLVCATGDRTETGRIASLVTNAVDISTPLTRKIKQFTQRMLAAIMILAVVAFGVGVWRGESPSEMFLAAVALAVGAIPEGLPAAVTITLAIGVSRMARRRAIIRRLPVVETIGSVTVICTDKTGTLTENQMTVREIFAGGKLYNATGDGYESNGQIRHNNAAVDLTKEPALLECLKAGLLCNDSKIVRENGRSVVQGDPTEAALIVAAHKAGLTAPELHSRHARVDMIPFESEHMFRATLHHATTHRVIYQVGALERLLDRCADCLDAHGRPAPLDKAAITHAAERMADSGLRVLAMTRREVQRDHARLEHDHVRSHLTFVGLQGMIDPPRQEAIKAVARCQQAGIAVKMITGDHGLTASAIARQVGLKSGSGEVVTGREIANVSDTDLPNIAERASVFARVAPEDKLRLVKGLQSRGHIVAMTGDGVNDAPALKQADAGIAMGLSGTDVARGAADMLLTDDNFATIEAAVEEGRSVFNNLTKFIIWTLPTNAGEALLLLTAIVFGTTLPALPTQLLWVNMTTALFLGLMLVFEPKEKDLMRRQPRDPKEPILTYPLFMRTGLVTLIMLVGAFALFLWQQNQPGATLLEARTAVVNAIVLVEVFYLLNCRSLTHSMYSLGLFSNRWIIVGIGGMIAAQLLFTYAPIMNRLFHTAPIGWDAWLRILLIALFAWTAVGFEKWIRFRARPLAGSRNSIRSRSRPLTPRGCSAQ